MGYLLLETVKADYYQCPLPQDIKGEWELCVLCLCGWWICPSGALVDVVVLHNTQNCKDCYSSGFWNPNNFPSSLPTKIKQTNKKIPNTPQTRNVQIFTHTKFTSRCNKKQLWKLDLYPVKSLLLEEGECQIPLDAILPPPPRPTPSLPKRHHSWAEWQLRFYPSQGILVMTGVFHAGQSLTEIPVILKCRQELAIKTFVAFQSCWMSIYNKYILHVF